ncbi:MAG TPA: nucleotide-binding domain containing protein, partial [Chitinophaga sp.]
MPASLVEHAAANDLLFKQWMNDILSHLKKSGKAAIAVHHDIKDNEVDAVAVRTVMAEAAAYITRHVQLNELLVEGGSTAAAVIRKLEIETLYPVAELAPGVTRMKVEGKQDLFLTLKPGSYEWPPSLL